MLLVFAVYIKKKTNHDQVPALHNHCYLGIKEPHQVADLISSSKVTGPVCVSVNSFMEPKCMEEALEKDVGSGGWVGESTVLEESLFVQPSVFHLLCLAYSDFKDTVIPLECIK